MKAHSKQNKGRQYEMNKTKFSKAALIALFSLTVAVHAQPKNKISRTDSSTRLFKIERDFSLKAKPKIEKPSGEKTSFAAETKANASSAANSSNRQTVYVRPSKEERLKRYVSDAFGIPAVIGATFGATVSQIGNNPPEWEKNVGGFGRRFASSYGTNAIRNTVSYGLSEAFKLDNRFEKSGQKNLGKRLKHVFLGSYTTRRKDGRRIPDFPHFIGTYSAAVIANETWYPKRFGYKDGLRDGTVSLGVRFGINLLREFVFPK